MALPIRNFPTPASAKMNKRVLTAGVPYPLSSIHPRFPLPPNLQPLLTPATMLRRLKEKDHGNRRKQYNTVKQRVGNCFLFGARDNKMNLIVLCSNEFVNFLIHKFPLSLLSNGSCLSLLTNNPRQKPWNTLENSAPFCNVVVAT